MPISVVLGVLIIFGATLFVFVKGRPGAPHDGDEAGTRGRITTGWRVAHIGFERDDFTLGGRQVWKETWRRVDFPKLTLAHPAYPNELHSFDVYEIGDPSNPIRFATTELSAGVFGFYVPEDTS